MTVLLTFVFSLATALTNAASATLQWSAASKAPPGKARGLHLATYLLQRPRYLAGLGALTVSFLLQAAALHEGRLDFVQPLLVTELPFTLVLSALWLGLRVDRQEVVGAAAICAGLAVFLGVGRPYGGRDTAPAATWVLAGVVTAALIGALALAARRGSPVRRTVLFALASGVSFSITAVLVKATTGRVSGGLLHVMEGWEPYAMILAGGLAVFLQQHALHSGDLAAAKPATTVINPIASIVLGIVVFRESLEPGAWVVLEILGLGVLVGGIVVLSRSPLVTGHRGGGPAHQERLSQCRRRVPDCAKAPSPSPLEEPNGERG